LNLVIIWLNSVLSVVVNLKHTAKGVGFTVWLSLCLSFWRWNYCSIQDWTWMFE